MPKTFRRLYDRLCAFEHLLEAYRRARRGKRRRPDVAAFEFRYEDQLHQLAAELRRPQQEQPEQQEQQPGYSACLFHRARRGRPAFRPVYGSAARPQ